MKQKSSLMSLMIMMVFSSAIQAALFDRGRGMIYDDRLDITWLQDANYAATSGYAAENEGSNFDGYPHEGEIISISEGGGMSWAAANQWANNLVYEGYDDWRLPVRRTDLGFSTTSYFRYQSETIHERPYYLSPPDYISPLATGDYIGGDLNIEMAFMYFVNLKNTGVNGVVYGPHGSIQREVLCGNSVGDCFSNAGPFINLSGSKYWSGDAVGSGSGSGGEYFNFGYPDDYYADSVVNQKYAWAVRSGDVIVMPIPSTLFLFGSGLIALLGVRTKRK